MRYEEIAPIVGRTPEGCRQLNRRAARALAAGRPRFAPSPVEHGRLVSEFVAAARAGDLARLQRMLHAEAVVHSDGGGRVRVARKPITTPAKIARFFVGLYSRPTSVEAIALELNAAPALLMETGRSRHVLAVEADRGLITRIFLMGNPEKLSALPTGAPEGSWRPAL